jgi:hypothetical protein
VLHSDLFPEFPYDSELIPVEALSKARTCVLWCSGSGTGFTFVPDSTWVGYAACSREKVRLLYNSGWLDAVRKS